MERNIYIKEMYLTGKVIKAINVTVNNNSNNDNSSIFECLLYASVTESKLSPRSLCLLMAGKVEARNTTLFEKID